MRIHMAPSNSLKSMILVIMIYIKAIPVTKTGCAADRLLGLRVRIPPGTWMSPVSCECCVLSSRGLCEGRSLVKGSPTHCDLYR
jgi:hypothetical protein